MKQGGRYKNGFTIVELLIIIVVVAILATLVVVGYNGVRDSANDTRRVADLNKLKDAITLWSTQTKTMPENSGTGYGNNGFGWVYGTGYAKSLETLLIETGYLDGEVRDPVIPVGSGSYMFYRCGTSTNNGLNKIYGLFARTKDPNAKGNEISKWQATGCATSQITSYNMNYVRIIYL